jgi:hypothetical protein
MLGLMPSCLHDRESKIHMLVVPACNEFVRAEKKRLIGSIRRECLDYVVVFGERHLRHLLGSYQRYYNEARTHLSLNKDAPISRTVETVGSIVAKPLLGGLPINTSGFVSGRVRYQAPVIGCAFAMRSRSWDRRRAQKPQTQQQRPNEPAPVGPPGRVAAVDNAQPAGERRHLAVMFCDLVDSTGIAAGEFDITANP